MARKKKHPPADPIRALRYDNSTRKNTPLAGLFPHRRIVAELRLPDWFAVPSPIALPLAASDALALVSALRNLTGKPR